MLFYRTGLELEHQALSAWIATDPCVLGSSLSTEYSTVFTLLILLGVEDSWCLLQLLATVLPDLLVECEMSEFTPTWRTRIYRIVHRTLLRLMNHRYPAFSLIIVYADSHDASDVPLVHIQYYVDDIVLVLRAPRF